MKNFYLIASVGVGLGVGYVLGTYATADSKKVEKKQRKRYTKEMAPAWAWWLFDAEDYERVLYREWEDQVQYHRILS